MKFAQHNEMSEADADDPRLLGAVQEYMAAVEAGRRPDIAELISRHRDIGEELLACIQGLAFVQSAAAQINPAPPAASIPAQPLGDFKLIREIGRGGMGIVYEAVQLSLGRPVAVKVLPLAAALDPNHLQRFKNEAQAAAQLHHTNIVPVYAVGCERSVHFYAMQLIDGLGLNDVIENLRAGKDGDDSSPSQTLSALRQGKRTEYFRAIARLGLQAAEALHYAHQAGVVHRDIKPANLMIDRRGNLWITDFGLAQFYNDTNLTRTGDMLGTLRYMSPEQASGRATVLDQRTDVYSLGMTLYELLTLECALTGQTRQELLYQIGLAEPRLARSIDKTIPPEWQTILTKATAKEPSERYANAQAMADDLRRYLSDQPILARPPSTFNRLAKWTRRHRSLAMSMLVTLILMSVGSAFSTVLIAREQAKTQAAYEAEEQQRIRAEKNFAQAREVVNFFTEVAADELPHNPQSNDAREHLLEVGLDYYQTFIDQSKGDPSLASELTAAKSRMFSILTELSATDDRMRKLHDLHLLEVESVQRELDLSQDQMERINAILPRMRPPMPPDGPGGPDGPGPRGGPPDRPPGPPMEMPSAAEAAQLDQQISVILTPTQEVRLHQISRQWRGGEAFSDPDVQTALNLTNAQKDFIRKTRTDHPQWRITLRTGGPGAMVMGGPEGGPPPPFGSEDASQVQKILQQLSPQQVGTWNSLTGKPFARDSLQFGARRF
jgi:eukaryotic-like serine/threonine-protein kinase